MRAAFAAALLGAGLAFAPPLAAQQQGHVHHENHDAATAADRPATSPLAEAGNGAFAAIQEVVRLLERRPDTDWTAVDLEALRRHLIDMQNMMLRAEVRSSEAIPGGVRFVVRGTDRPAHASIGRALDDHATMLRKERGWVLEVVPRDDGYHVAVVSPRPEDEAMIRGLGYAGIMALGGHHTRHHLMIATGNAPHGH
ncbi:MAG TPA: hypothetical protein VF158_07820 [Longimicrobiales bacterium]